MRATIIQLTGLVALIVGASIEFGPAGGIAAGGIGAVYVGLAMERD